MAVAESTTLAQTGQHAAIDKICDDLDKAAQAAVTNIKPKDKVKVKDKALQKDKDKDLQKTKMCVYHVQGKCGYGSDCQFAHCLSEIRKAPNLAKTQLCTAFMSGSCTKASCTYAHGEAELAQPPNFKKKVCVWYIQGKCRNGTKCSFAHSFTEMQNATPGIDAMMADSYKRKVAPPPGLIAHGDDDDDVSTDVPSSLSQAESGVNVARSTTTIPEENLFRMVAARGSAPMQQQVTLMGSAIAGLQAKLVHVEDPALQTQVTEMQQKIQQLTEQMQGMEVQQSLPPQAPPWKKTPKAQVDNNNDNASVSSPPPWRKKAS